LKTDAVKVLLIGKTFSVQFCSTVFEISWHVIRKKQAMIFVDYVTYVGVCLLMT